MKLLIIGLALILIALFAGEGICQQSAAQECVRIQQDMQRRIDDNFRREGEINQDLQREIQLCGNNQPRILEIVQTANKRKAELWADNERIKADANRACLEAQQRESARQFFDPKTPRRDPTVRYR